MANLMKVISPVWQTTMSDPNINYLNILHTDKFRKATDEIFENIRDHLRKWQRNARAKHQA